MPYFVVIEEQGPAWEAVDARSETVDWTCRVHRCSRRRTLCDSGWSVEILET